MRKLAFFLAGILFISLVSALNVSEKYNTNIIVRDINNPIDLTLTITNASSGLYNLYTLADISLEPSGTFTIPNGTIEKTFTIRPTENLNVRGYYTFTYTLNHRGVEKINKKFTVDLLNLEDVLEIG